MTSRATLAAVVTSRAAPARFSSANLGAPSVVAAQARASFSRSASSPYVGTSPRSTVPRRSASASAASTRWRSTARLRSVVTCCVVLAARSQCRTASAKASERLVDVADAGLQRAVRHDGGAFEVAVVDRAGVGEGVAEVGQGAVWIVPLAELAARVGEPPPTGRRERELVEHCSARPRVSRAGDAPVGGGQRDAAVAEGEVEEVAMAAREFAQGPARRRRSRSTCPSNKPASVSTSSAGDGGGPVAGTSHRF